MLIQSATTHAQISRIRQSCKRNFELCHQPCLIIQRIVVKRKTEHESCKMKLTAINSRSTSLRDIEKKLVCVNVQSVNVLKCTINQLISEYSL